MTTTRINGITKRQAQKSDCIDRKYRINAEKAYMDFEGILYVELLDIPQRWYSILRDGTVFNQWGEKIDFRRDF